MGEIKELAERVGSVGRKSVLPRQTADEPANRLRDALARWGSDAPDWVQGELDAGHRVNPRRQAKVSLTEFQRAAVALLAKAMRCGAYNLQVNWPKVEWKYGRGVRFVLWTSGLSTFDFDHLTRLVIAAHEACIRVEVEPVNFRHIAIVMHPRDPEGRMHERHPTIEEAVALFRGNAPSAGSRHPVAADGEVQGEARNDRTQEVPHA